jgi:uridine phosphorylase
MHLHRTSFSYLCAFMKSGLEQSELILRGDQRVYHLNLRAGDIADDVILVGDPGRVEDVARHFSAREFSTAHREFISVTGTCNGKRLTVLSTGIGTDNIDIVVNELDAAVNIDPLTREVNRNQKKLKLYRLGTCGALQADLPVDTLVVSTHGLGLDCLLNYYADSGRVADQEMSAAFARHAEWKGTAYPFCVEADTELLAAFSRHDGVKSGITATAPGFYGPQGRSLRLQPAFNVGDTLASFSWNGLRILNFEMETSALYGLGKMLGHRCLTVCVVIANRARKEFSGDYSRSVDRLIRTSLNLITGL